MSKHNIGTSCVSGGNHRIYYTKYCSRMNTPKKERRTHLKLNTGNRKWCSEATYLPLHALGPPICKKESGIPPPNKRRLTKTLKFIKAANTFSSD